MSVQIAFIWVTWRGRKRFFSSITLQDLELFQEDIAWIGFLLIVCIHAHLEEFAVCSSAFVCVCYTKISQVFWQKLMVLFISSYLTRIEENLEYIFYSLTEAEFRQELSRKEVLHRNSSGSLIKRLALDWGGNGILLRQMLKNEGSFLISQVRIWKYDSHNSTNFSALFHAQQKFLLGSIEGTFFFPLLFSNLRNSNN